MSDRPVSKTFIDDQWDRSALPELIEYARIPNKSPLFDSQWEANGHMQRAAERFRAWCAAQPIPGMTVEIVREPGRTPLLLLEVPGQRAGNVLLYGHLDKQPEMSGWREGLSPWVPVIDGERFYARGVADDGYATFAALIAIRALQERGIPHPRCVVLIEACEESGSEDLPFYIGRLAARIGIPELVVCLDASCGSYDRIWCTTSLRGVLNGLLRVDVLTEGVHSGDASGIVPSSFRVLRQLLARIEDTESGRVLPAFLQAALPDSAIDDARQVADALGEQVHARFPFAGGTRPATPDGTELILNGTRRPTLSVIGADGLPPPASAGNVLRPFSVLMLSLRLSPGVDADAASRGLKELLENDSPCNAAVSFTVTSCAPGWLAPAMTPTLRNAIDAASCRHFGRPAAYMGDGGSIPFMHMLGERFPRAQFFITGLLGPGSNAHGPNEFMHIPTVKKLTACVAEVIAAHRD